MLSRAILLEAPQLEHFVEMPGAKSVNKGPRFFEGPQAGMADLAGILPSGEPQLDLFCSSNGETGSNGSAAKRLIDETPSAFRCVKRLVELEQIASARRWCWLAGLVEKVFDISLREWEPDVEHHRQADDSRAGFNVLERVAFWHASRVGARSAGLEPSSSDMTPRSLAV